MADTAWFASEQIEQIITDSDGKVYLCDACPCDAVPSGCGTGDCISLRVWFQPGPTPFGSGFNDSLLQYADLSQVGTGWEGIFGTYLNGGSSLNPVPFIYDPSFPTPNYSFRLPLSDCDGPADEEVLTEGAGVSCGDFCNEGFANGCATFPLTYKPLTFGTFFDTSCLGDVGLLSEYSLYLTSKAGIPIFPCRRFYGPRFYFVATGAAATTYGASGTLLFFGDYATLGGQAWTQADKDYLASDMLVFGFNQVCSSAGYPEGTVNLQDFAVSFTDDRVPDSVNPLSVTFHPSTGGTITVFE